MENWGETKGIITTVEGGVCCALDSRVQLTLIVLMN